MDLKRVSQSILLTHLPDSEVIGLCGGWKISVASGNSIYSIYLEQIESHTKKKIPFDIKTTIGTDRFNRFKRISAWILEEVRQLNGTPTIDELRVLASNPVHEKALNCFSSYDVSTNLGIIVAVMWAWTRAHVEFHKTLKEYSALPPITFRSILYEPNFTFDSLLNKGIFEPVTRKLQSENRILSQEEQKALGAEWASELSSLPFYETMYFFVLGVHDYLRDYDVRTSPDMSHEKARLLFYQSLAGSLGTY